MDRPKSGSPNQRYRVSPAPEILSESRPQQRDAGWEAAITVVVVL